MFIKTMIWIYFLEIIVANFQLNATGAIKLQWTTMSKIQTKELYSCSDSWLRIANHSSLLQITEKLTVHFHLFMLKVINLDIVMRFNFRMVIDDGWAFWDKKSRLLRFESAIYRFISDGKSQESENISGYIVSWVTQTNCFAHHTSLFSFISLSENKDHFCIASGKL
jgi:hypothetical protein